MKVVHLYHRSRAAFGVMQGLLALGHDVGCETDYRSRGQLVHARSGDIFADMIECDLIFMNDTVQHGEFIDRNRLWGKVIFYDYRDTTTLQREAWQKSPIYFKRSFYQGDRVRIDHMHVRPIHHCALDEYYGDRVVPRHDVGCFFDLDNKNIGTRRRNLLTALLARRLPDSLVGASTAFGGAARLSIEDAPGGNPFYDFLAMQRDCKVVFTAQPEKVDGDNRTWEAFAAGGLVVRDRSYSETENPTLDGVHCLVYDAADPDSIEDAIDRAAYYLRHPDERETIARAGHDHVMKYHRPANRVLAMIDGFRERRKLLM